MAKIEIYTKSTCPYCARAKALLAQKGAAYREIDVERHPDKRAEMVARANGGNTVPQIFINDAHIGGCDDIHALDAAGGLDPLLRP